MPLVDNTGLPSYRRLREEGTEVLEKNRAQEQDIRELHIGLLNMNSSVFCHVPPPR